MSPPEKSWHRTVLGTGTDQEVYMVSTSKSLLPPSFVQECFSGSEMWWANPMSPSNMSLMLENSCTLGLYHIKGPGDSNTVPIGMARLITDYTTFAFLTDVLVIEAYQGKGLGKWLVQCLREYVDDIPCLRRHMLVTSETSGLYERLLGMETVGEYKGCAIMNYSRSSFPAPSERVGRKD